MNSKKILFVGGILILLLAVFWKACVYERQDTLTTKGNRPDVEEQIKEVFARSRRKQLVALQLARVLQAGIDSPTSALELEPRMKNALSCLVAIEEIELPESNPISLTVESIVVNNWKRSRAYAKYNGHLSGQIFDMDKPDLNACEFDASKK